MYFTLFLKAEKESSNAFKVSFSEGKLATLLDLPSNNTITRHFVCSTAFLLPRKCKVFALKFSHPPQLLSKRFEIRLTAREIFLLLIYPKKRKKNNNNNEKHSAHKRKLFFFSRNSLAKTFSTKT
jgi:hypothetical protein